MSASPHEEFRSTLEDQISVAVTIYNENLALVKDRRRLHLPQGASDLAFRDVSARIRPETALFRSLSPGAALQVLEQNFDFDLLTPEKMLEKFVGHRVGLIKTHPTTGEESEESAEVLSAAQGVVLRLGERIETGIPGRMVFREVPASLRDRPTLVMQLENAFEGPQELELAYLTGGLSWQADYVGELSADDRLLDLTGWVTLRNTSGTRYREAHLQLVAGAVNQVPEDEEADLAFDALPAPPMAAASSPMREETLFEYHLYTLPRPTTLADNQSKQVALLRAQAIPVRKELLFDGSHAYYRHPRGAIGVKLKAGVFVELENRTESNLGLPLPKGVVRLYKNDLAGNAQFVGEDRIDHTPKNETVRLKLGEAFDVTADKTQTDFKKISGMGPWQYQFESAYRIEIKNAKPEPVEVKVREPIPGDWNLLEQSHPAVKESADTAAWALSIPAEDQTTLTYRVRVRF